MTTQRAERTTHHTVKENGRGWRLGPGVQPISKRSGGIALATLMLLLLALSPGHGRTALEARKELASIGTEFKRSVFIESAKESDAVAVELFLDAGMNPTVADADGKTALVWAAIENHVKILELLAAAHIDLDGSASDSSGRTPLHWAASENSLDAVRFLIQAGADRNALDNQGDNALLHAVKRNNGAVARVLLDAGIDVNTPDRNGVSPIMWATLHGWTEGFELLREAGADLTARIRSATTVTDANTGGWYAVEAGSTVLTVAASRGHAGIVRKLLATARPNTEDGVVALTRAASNGHSDVVKLLLGTRVPVNGRDARNRTALFYASGNGDADVVRDLLTAGANEQMDIALINAASGGHTPVVTMLMQAGADAEVASDDWAKVVRIARERGYAAIIEIFERTRSEPSGENEEPTAQDIRHFQGCLQAFGYDPGTMDGILGDMTVKALRQFQGHSNLPETGLLDRATQEALMERRCPRIPASTRPSDQRSLRKHGEGP